MLPNHGKSPEPSSIGTPACDDDSLSAGRIFSFPLFEVLHNTQQAHQTLESGPGLPEAPRCARLEEAGHHRGHYRRKWRRAISAALALSFNRSFYRARATEPDRDPAAAPYQAGARPPPAYGVPEPSL